MLTKPSLSLITCSYGPDLDRCRTLCASVARHVDPAIEHVLIVPRRDRDAFAPLAGDRTRLVTVESILPIGARLLPWQRRWWLTAGSPPVRGWIMQQVTKLAAIDATERDAVVFADSDVVFVRRFEPGMVFEDGGLRLYRAPGPPPKPTHQRWHAAAGRLLGLEPADGYGADYIGQLIAWRRDTVHALRRRISQTAGGKPWASVLCNTLHFSEYILYGVFVEHLLHGQGHRYTDRELCHCSWHHQVRSAADVERFLEQIAPDQVAVLVQSNLGIEPGAYQQKITQLEASSSAVPTKPMGATA